MKSRKVDALVFEIGSTTTVVNAFDGLDTDNPVFIAGGQSATTVLEGDVTIGLQKAIEDLCKVIGALKIEPREIFATSSAAGGLRMTVHGLVHDMTVKAAREAALGAGANIKMITSGMLRRTDLAKIKDISPNIILIAGGVDYGERDTAISNAEKIAALDMDVPVIYAGNIENQEEIKLIFEENGKGDYLHIVDNVYPRIDTLNVEPTRKVIQDVFEEHIVHAKGMEHIRDIVHESIIPTPGAVMLATKLLHENIGDVMTVDVGGATTDVHSVTDGSDEISRILIAPEPKAKRTVEGDLGLFVNMRNVYESSDLRDMMIRTGLDEVRIEKVLQDFSPIPVTDDQKAFVSYLAREAVITSVHRHAGGIRDLFYSGGKKSLAEGKDLTNIRHVIGTGGALTRLEAGKEILLSIPESNKGDKLLPQPGFNVLIDHDYIMASLGVLSLKYEKQSLLLLLESLKVGE